MNEVPEEVLVHIFEYVSTPARARANTHYPRIFRPAQDTQQHYRTLFKTVVPVCKRWKHACLNEGQSTLFTQLRLEGNNQFTDQNLVSISTKECFSQLHEIILEQVVVELHNQNTNMTQNGVMKFFENIIRRNTPITNLRFKLLLHQKRQALFDIGILCASLSRFYNLTTLEFTSLHLTDDSFIDMIAEMPHLQEIDVWGCEQLSNRSLLFICNQPTLQQQLKSLSIGAFNIQLTDTSISELHKLSNLKHLYMSRCHRVRDVSTLPISLVTLDLSFCTNLTTCEHLIHLTNLRSLNIRRAGTDLHESLPMLSHLPNLRAINLRELGVTDDICRETIRQMIYLESIDLYDCNSITSSSVFLTPQHIHVQHLNLFDIHTMDNESVMTIFETCKQLSTLVVTIPRVTDELFKTLPINDTLKTLSIHNAIKITNSGFKSICDTFVQLESFMFMRCNPHLITENALGCLSTLKQLKSLDLTSFPLSSYFENVVKYFEVLPRLEVLMLRNCLINLKTNDTDKDAIDNYVTALLPAHIKSFSY
jgi:hypothetical protein